MTPLPTQLMKEYFMAEDILLVDGNGEKVDTQKIGLRQNHKIFTQAGLKDNQERTIISKLKIQLNTTTWSCAHQSKQN